MAKTRSSLQLALFALPHIRNPTAQNNLPAIQVLRLERDFSRSVRSLSDFPDRDFERIAGADGAGESGAEEAQSGGVVPADGREHSARGVPEGAEPVKDDASEVCCFTDAWV